MKKIILMYHCVYCNDFYESGFQEGNAWQYKVQKKNFEKQILAISSYCKNNKINKENIELTFDDGGVSFLIVIAPILEKYGFKGIFYISTKYIGTPGFLSKEQVKELYDRGHIIGSHSHSHPNNLGKMKYEEILQEWRESKSILENIIQDKVVFASIPNGNGSNLVYKAALNAGFEILDTSIPATKSNHYQDMIVRGRYVVHNNMNAKDLLRIISSDRKRKILYNKWKILSFMKFILGAKYEKMKEMFLNN